MRFLPWIFPVLFLFRLEILQFFVNLTFIQWVLLLGIAALCLIPFKRKAKCSIRAFIRKLKYFNLRRYRGKLLRWARESDSNVIGKSLVSQLERNVFIKLSCIALSCAIFSHYPRLLLNPMPSTVFLLALTIYSLTSLAFRREVLIFMVGIYFLMALVPYAIAFLSYEEGINLFKTLPADVVYWLGIDIANLTQTANKLFLVLAPCAALIILFFVLFSVIIRGSLNLIFTVFIKIIKLILS